MLFVEATTKRDGLTTYLSRCPISPTYLYSRASNNHPAYKMSISQIYQNMPATIKLLKAFSRWQRKDNSYQKKAVGHNDPRFLEDHQLEPYAPVPPPAAVHFVSSLSPVDLADIPEDDRVCCICAKPYHTLVDQKLDGRKEVALSLSCCRNVVGNLCLFEWLDPRAPANNVSCAFCRAKCFEKFAHLRTIEGLQARVDLADWAIQTQPQKALPETKEGSWRAKTLIAKHWLGEACQELEHSHLEIENKTLRRIERMEATYPGVPEIARQALCLDHDFSLHEILLGGIRMQLQLSEARRKLQAQLTKNRGDRDEVQEMRQVLQDLHRQSAEQANWDQREGGEQEEVEVEDDEGHWMHRESTQEWAINREH